MSAEKTSPRKAIKLLEYFAIFIWLAILHVYYIRRTTPERLVIEENPLFKLYGPYTKKTPNNILPRINTSKIIDLDFKYLIKEKCESNLLLLVLVASSLLNFEKRNAIRETWGKSNDAMKVVFLLGKMDDKTVTKDIVFESYLYKDIVQGDFEDTYRNLTYKHIMGLQWACTHCARARYVAKVDDDVFVNYKEVISFITRQLSPWGAKDLILCWALLNQMVQRDPNNKWYVSEDDFGDPVYPYFCSGFFIIYSQDVLPVLVWYSEINDYFFIDDVFVTGMIAEQASIPRTDIKYMFLGRDKYDKFLKFESEIEPFMVGPVNIQPDSIRSFWRYLVKPRK